LVEFIVDRDILYDLYIVKGYSTRKCAEILNTNHMTIQKYILKNGIELRNKSESNKVKIISKESKLKMSIAKKGKKLSEKHRLNCCGMIPWNKNNGNETFVCRVCGKETIDKHYRRHMYCSKKCMNLAKGEQHINYKGLMSRGEQTKRNWKEYKDFKKSVHIRDKGQCLCCDSKTKLDAHHLIPWSYDPLLRFNIENAITLCRSCHRELHKYCGQKKIDLDKQKEWLLNHLRKAV